MASGTVLVAGAGFSTAVGHPLTKHLPEALAAMLAFHRGAFSEHSPANWYRRFLREFIRADEKRRKQGGDALDFEEVLTAIYDAMNAWRGRVAPVIGNDPLHANSPDADFHRIHDWGWTSKFDIDPYQLDQGGEPEPLFAHSTWVLGELLGRPKLDAAQCARMIKAKLGPLTGAVTTNYDLLLEDIFDGDVDYGFSASEWQLVEGLRQSKEGKIWVTAKPTAVAANAATVLKLHGSINQGYCIGCNRVLRFPRSVGAATSPAIAWYGF